jgi:hypothetical protein
MRVNFNPTRIQVTEATQVEVNMEIVESPMNKDNRMIKKEVNLVTDNKEMNQETSIEDKKAKIPDHNNGDNKITIKKFKTEVNQAVKDRIQMEDKPTNKEDKTMDLFNGEAQTKEKAKIKDKSSTTGVMREMIKVKVKIDKATKKEVGDPKIKESNVRGDNKDLGKFKGEIKENPTIMKDLS